MCWIVPADALPTTDGDMKIRPLDLEAEIDRFGEALVGGR